MPGLRAPGSKAREYQRERDRAAALRVFALFFAAQFVLYGLLTWNYRAVALFWPVSLVASDLMIATLQFEVIGRIGENKTRAARLGYALGGACGSLLSLYLTRRVFGQ